jgi:DNA-binding transcriptional LysR family regulator
VNLTHLRSLAAAADTGSFTAAAEALGVTQSGISQAIAALEESLGVKLLIRLRHGVELTAIGEQVVDHARTALAAIEGIQKDAAVARGEEADVIRVAGFASAFSTFLPAILRRFRNRYPGVEIVALEGSDDEVEHWLASGAVDIGVILNPTDERRAIVIGQDEWMAVLPASHRFARRATIPLAELAAEPFVLATGGCSVNARSLAGAAGLTLSHVAIEVRDWASALARAISGARATRSAVNGSNG